MRLFFDVSNLPDVGRAVTGISRVVLSLLSELMHMGSACCELYGISFRSEDMFEYPHGRLWSLGDMLFSAGPAMQFETVSSDLLQRHPEVLQRGDVVICLGEQWLFPETIPTLGKLKESHGIKVVSLVHDLVPFFMPELYWPTFPETYCHCLSKLVDLSDALMVYSENTRRDLFQWIPAAASKPVVRLHLGSELGSIEPKRPSEIDDGKFILCVSTIQPRKNQALLLPVWRLLLAQWGERCPRLVLVGKKGWNSDDLLYFFENNPSLKKFITILEQQTDASLCWLYQNSWLTIYPSLYEGWGLPIAESLAVGKLCLSSNASSMPEVGGDLVDYFSPYDPMKLYRLIEKYMVDQSALESAEARIRQHYIPGSWRECALDLLLAAGGSLKA